MFAEIEYNSSKKNIHSQFFDTILLFISRLDFVIVKVDFTQKIKLKNLKPPLISKNKSKFEYIYREKKLSKLDRGRIKKVR